MRVFFSRLLPPFPLVFPCIASGAMITLCFPVVSWWWLSFVALVPALVAVLRLRPSRTDAFRAGFLLGFTCYFSMLWWIAKLIPSADVTIPWLMTPALIILVLYLALYPAFFMLLLAAVSNWRFGSVFLAAPALWVILDLARSRGELGFPWGALGYAVTKAPQLMQPASIAGLPALTFLIVLVNVAVAGVLAARRPSGRVLSAAAVGAVLLGWWYLGAERLEHVHAGADSTAAVTVGVVQPNVDLEVKWKPEFKDSTFRLIERLTEEAVAKGAEMVIFPETSAPIYIDHPRYAKYKQQLVSLARRTGRPLFIGLLDYRRVDGEADVKSYNSSALFLPDGRIEKYDKHHLLPFGEALPLAWKFPWLERINFGQANWARGRMRDPLSAPGFSFTPLICFESVFPYLSRYGVRHGAEVLVNITNDGWFSDTPGPYQHAQMAIVRAVETRRWLLRSANTGVSFVVDPEGRVVDRIDLFEEGILVNDIIPRDGLSVYVRHGDLPLLLLCLVLAALGLFARAPRVGHDDDPDDGGPEPLIRARDG